MHQRPGIRILRERCVRCGDCVDLCPQSGPDLDSPVYIQDQTSRSIKVANVSSCISCFTCVEFCRASAIVMADTPLSRVDRVKLYPSRPPVRII